MRPRLNWIRTFLTSGLISVPASGEAFVSVTTINIPIPAKAGIRIMIGDVNVFCPDAAAANQKLQATSMDLLASLLNAAQQATAVAVLASITNTRTLAANAGNVEGVTAMMDREFLIPADIVGSSGAPVIVQFFGGADVTNTDGALAHNAQIAIDVLWSFETFPPA